MKTPRERTRALLLVMLCQLLLPAGAAAYAVKVRWDAAFDPDIAGYRLYVRADGDAYGPPRDVMPDVDGDGGFFTVLDDLEVERTYTFALSAYTSDGRESARSNERTIGYAEAAAVVDSDGDGLPDAAEDTNLNGVQDEGETDRLRADSDGDLVPDGVERARGSDPLDAASPACAELALSDFGFGSGGIADVVYDADAGDDVLHATQTARAPLRFRASYPAHGKVAITAPVLATAIQSTRRFRVEVAVRAVSGRRYTLRYDGNGGADQLSRRTLTIALGDAFARDGGWVAFGRDLGADLALLDPNAILATVTRVRVRGDYSMRTPRACY